MSADFPPVTPNRRWLLSLNRSTIRACFKMSIASDEAISEALQGLLKRKGVQGYVILDKSGVPIKSSFEPAAAQTYAGLVPPLVYLADDMVRDADPQDVLQFLRVRSAKQEIMVSAHAHYTLAVIQATATQAMGK